MKNTIEDPLKITYNYITSKYEIPNVKENFDSALFVDLSEALALKERIDELTEQVMLLSQDKASLRSEVAEQKQLMAEMAEALKKISNVKREDYKYPYHRCWNIAVDAMSKYNESIKNK